MQAEALRKANREAHERRLLLETAKQEKAALVAEVEKLRAANASAEERAIAEARANAAKERDDAWRPTVIRVTADGALASAGCRDTEQRAMLIQLIDATKVELDATGAVVAGLEDQIERVKEKFPTAFAAPVTAIPPARQVDAGEKRAPAKTMTATERQAARLRGEKV